MFQIDPNYSGWRLLEILQCGCVSHQECMDLVQAISGIQVLSYEARHPVEPAS